MPSLIDTQTTLLRHLTSPVFIFGTRELDSVGRDPGLRGMDVSRLRLEAEFSFSKRMTRIRRTFERTATLMGSGFSALLRDFAAACPPATYERYPDAERFHEHFLQRCTQEPPTPAWTADVAAIELALARARTLRPTAMETASLAARPQPSAHLWYRAHPCLVLLRCGYDVRPLFETGRHREPVTHRPVRLAVLAARGRRQPTVAELEPEPFELLERSTSWSRLAPDGAPGTRDTHGALVKRLAARGLALLSGNDLEDGRRG